MTVLPANSTPEQVATAFAGLLQQPSQQVQQPAATQAEPAQPARRRRRTAAEMQAAQTSPSAGQPQGTPAAAPQAPFPHPGQATQNTGQAAAQNPSPGSFGIAQGQPAAANPELSAMLDDFFK